MTVKVCILFSSVIFISCGQHNHVHQESKLRVPRASIPGPESKDCSTLEDCPVDKICLDNKCVGTFNSRCKIVETITHCYCLDGFTGDPNSRCYRIKPTENPPTQSKTVMDGKRACQGEIIFEENFNSLDSSKWEHDVRIAEKPDYEFVTYTARSDNSFVQNGILHVKPTYTTDVYGENFITQGKLSLEGCTGIPGSTDCTKQAKSYNILPPILSARLRTRNYFNFCYGRVEIRAKLPAGDWIFPEIWLQPKYDWYGGEFLSGRIQMAMSKGNRELYKQDQPQKHIGEQMLEAGITLGIDETITNLMHSKQNPENEGWNRKFHLYSMEWTP
ncbi:hypothetical protein L9F63_007200, partial [Diploptera punctata]